MTNTNLGIIEVNSLIPVATFEREKFFLNENNEVQAVIDVVKNYYSNITFCGMDGNTEVGRKAIKKVAAELNNKIKEIDAIGKSVTDILKEKPKKIDAGRKIVRDALTELYEEIRKPVVEWEAEQAQIKAEEEARIAEEQRKKDAELEVLRAKAAQQEREKQIAEEAANKAKLEAETRAKVAELKLQQEREEAQRKEQARLAEENRKADEEARLKTQEQARINNLEHQRNVKNQIYKEFLNFGVSSEEAKNIIALIADGKISNITINY